MSDVDDGREVGSVVAGCERAGCERAGFGRAGFEKMGPGKVDEGEPRAGAEVGAAHGPDMEGEEQGRIESTHVFLSSLWFSLHFQILKPCY